VNNRIRLSRAHVCILSCVRTANEWMRSVRNGRVWSVDGKRNPICIYTYKRVDGWQKWCELRDGGEITLCAHVWREKRRNENMKYVRRRLYTAVRRVTTTTTTIIITRMNILCSRRRSTVARTSRG
jgi:hypothetical protein